MGYIWTIILLSVSSIIAQPYTQSELGWPRGYGNGSSVIISCTNIVTATNSIVITPTNTAANITLLGGNTATNALWFFITANPTNGSLSSFNTNSGTLTYTPANNYAGADNFYFGVSDGCKYATGNVAITVVSNDGNVGCFDVVATSPTYLCRTFYVTNPCITSCWELRPPGTSECTTNCNLTSGTAYTLCQWVTNSGTFCYTNTAIPCLTNMTYGPVSGEASVLTTINNNTFSLATNIAAGFHTFLVPITRLAYCHTNLAVNLNGTLVCNWSGSQTYTNRQWYYIIYNSTTNQISTSFGAGTGNCPGTSSGIGLAGTYNIPLTNGLVTNLTFMFTITNSQPRSYILNVTNQLTAP